MAILYKGYAQQKGFAAWKVDIPDPSKRIREQGLEQMRGMEEQLEWNQNQLNRVSNALEKNAIREAQQRRDNFELRQMFSGKMADAKIRNLQALADQAERDKEQRQKNLKNLLYITQKGRQLWQGWEKKKKEDAMEYAHSSWEQHGIGWEELQQIQSQKDIVWNDDASKQQFLEGLGLDGVSHDIIHEYRNLGGYKKIAMAELHAKNWAYGSEGYYADKWNEQVDMADGSKLSLADANQKNIDIVLQKLDAKRRREAGMNAPTSKMLATSGGYEINEKARASIRRRKTETAARDAIESQYEDEHTFIEHAISVGGPDGRRDAGAGINRLIQYYAGGKNATGERLSQSRKRVTKALINGLETGRYSWDEVKDLGTYRVVTKGSPKGKPWGELFKTEWANIENAGMAAHRRDMGVAALETSANEVKGVKFYGEMLQLAKENPDQETWGRMLAIARKNDWKEAQRYIADRMARGRSELTDAAAEGKIKDMIARHQHVSPEDVQNTGASNEMQAELLKLATKNNDYLPTGGEYGTEARLVKGIDGLLEGIIPTKVTGSDDTTRFEAKIHALDRAKEQYKAARTKGMSHEDAFEHARSAIQKDILDPGGLWGRRYNTRTNRHEFQGFSANNTVEKINVDEGMPELHADKGRIFTNAYINKSDLAAKSSALNRGERQSILPRSAFIQSHTRNAINALDAELAQIEYYNKVAKENGQDLIAPYPDWYVKSVRESYDGISPRVQRLLTEFDYSGPNKAYIKSGLNPVYTKPSVQKAQQILSNNTDYDRTDKGNSVQKLGFNITRSSIREILSLQSNGKLILAGRYSFDAEALEEAAGIANISLDAPFNAVNQDRLFEAYFKTNGQTIINGVEKDEERLLLENVYNTLTSDNRDTTYGMHNPAFLRPEAYSLLYSGGRYG